MQYNHLKPNSNFKDNLKFSVCEQCRRLKFTVKRRTLFSVENRWKAKYSTMAGIIFERMRIIHSAAA